MRMNALNFKFNCDSKNTELYIKENVNPKNQYISNF